MKEIVTAETGEGLPAESPSFLVIEPRRGVLNFDLRSLWEYRELFLFLIWRDIKGRYAQSVLGIGWAVIQPVFSMIVFTVVFGKLARISSDGTPYALFSYTGLVPWTYFSNALTASSESLIQNSNLLKKIYFPRMIIPFAPVIGKLIDFSISFTLLFVFMFYFSVRPTILVVFLPVLMIIVVLSSSGLGMLLTALAIQYRDVSYGFRFFVQLLMYAAPVVYPTSLVPSEFRLIYGLNPMVGVIEGFRASLLGSVPMPWDLIGLGSITAVLMFVVGLLFFRHRERLFADVA